MVAAEEDAFCFPPVVAAAADAFSGFPPAAAEALSPREEAGEESSSEDRKVLVLATRPAESTSFMHLMSDLSREQDTQQHVGLFTGDVVVVSDG